MIDGPKKYNILSIINRVMIFFFTRLICFSNEKFVISFPPLPFKI